MDQAGLPGPARGRGGRADRGHPRDRPRRRRDARRRHHDRTPSAGPDRISPFFIPMGIPNVGAGQIAISFGMTGPNFTTVSACATGGHAIGEAWETIRRGDADTMIAGGSRGRHLRAARRRLRLDARAVAPQRRPGGRLAAVRQGPRRVRPGRGLRRRSSSRSWSTRRARGATILAELIGYGATADASHITLPAPGGIGAVRAARRALAQGRPRRRATSTTSTPTRRRRREGDKAELQAIRTIFGDRAADGLDHRQQVDDRATRSARPGAIEAIVTILTIRESCVPPTINLEDPDDEVGGPRHRHRSDAQARTSRSRCRTRSGSAARTRP